MSALPEEEKYTIRDIEALPDGQRAELINGRLYAMAPPSRYHQDLSMALSGTIFAHIRKNKGICRVYTAPFAVYLCSDDKTYVEPDISVICDPDKLTDKGCSGAPDWIIEITSPGTWLHDVYRKLDLYKAAGVKEYWIISPKEGTVAVHTFPDSAEYTFDDDIPASIWPGFSIRISDLL